MRDRALLGRGYPRAFEVIVGLVARLTARAKSVPALTARGNSRRGHQVRYSSTEALH